MRRRAHRHPRLHRLWAHPAPHGRLRHAPPLARCRHQGALARVARPGRKARSSRCSPTIRINQNIAHLINEDLLITRPYFSPTPHSSTWWACIFCKRKRKRNHYVRYFSWKGWLCSLGKLTHFTERVDSFHWKVDFIRIQLTFHLVIIVASINSRTNTVNPELRQAAINAAKQAAFNKVKSKENQIGTITFYFKII